MTLEQIDDSLPNGLHDALIEKLDIDYEQSQVTLNISVLVGLPGQPYPECERYETGEILFKNVQFCSIEYPEPSSSFAHPGRLWFSYERTPSGKTPSAIEKLLPPETQRYSIFIRDWLSSIHVAAAAVSFSWIKTADEGRIE